MGSKQDRDERFEKGVDKIIETVITPSKPAPAPPRPKPAPVVPDDGPPHT